MEVIAAVFSVAKLPLLVGSPVLFTILGIEAFLSYRRRDGRYELRDSFLSAALGGGNFVVNHALWYPFGIFMSSFFYQLTPLRVDMTSPWSWVALVLLNDLAFYVCHVCEHKVRLFWASHAVHHSAEQFNLTVAFRNGWTTGLHNWLFVAPVVALGFPPWALAITDGFSFSWQFFVHSANAPSLGLLEWFMNTPVHHRVHHARNERYFDKNFAGLLIIWDRLFGTFARAEAIDPPRYEAPEHTYNPFAVAFGEWKRMFADVFTAGRTG